MDEAERETLRLRIEEIDLLLKSIGFRISPSWKIISEGNTSRVHWSGALFGVALFYTKTPGPYWGLALITLCIAANLYFYLSLNFSRMQIKIFEIELYKIRNRLFGHWNNWYLNIPELDQALLDYTSNEGSDGFYSKNFEQGTFETNLYRSDYTKRNFNPGETLKNGDVQVHISGNLWTFPPGAKEDDCRPHITIKLGIYVGFWLYAQTLTFKNPPKMLPKSWPKLHALFRQTKSLNAMKSKTK